jgi:hypothetical protein
MLYNDNIKGRLIKKLISSYMNINSISGTRLRYYLIISKNYIENSKTSGDIQTTIDKDIKEIELVLAEIKEQK